MPRITFITPKDERIEIDAPEEFQTEIYSFGEAKKQGDKIILPAYSSIVLEY